MKKKKKRNENKYVKESGGISDIVPHPSLSCNTNFVLIYGRRLSPRLLHSLVPIHLLCFTPKINTQNPTQTKKPSKTHKRKEGIWGNRRVKLTSPGTGFGFGCF